MHCDTCCYLCISSKWETTASVDPAAAEPQSLWQCWYVQLPSASHLAPKHAYHSIIPNIIQHLQLRSNPSPEGAQQWAAPFLKREAVCPPAVFVLNWVLLTGVEQHVLTEMSQSWQLGRV